LEKIRVKLNFQADKPTVNGHVYSKEILKKAFDERFSNGNVFVVDSYSGENVDLGKIIAVAKSYEINSNSEILIDIKPLKMHLKEIFEDNHLVNFEITSSGFGTIDEKTKIINDFKLSYFFVVGKNNE
jgi:predicted kinase